VVDKFEASTGIVRRFYAPDDWATSDLAVAAAKRALSNAGMGPRDLDLVIVGTDSPDYVTPATSVVVQHKLGATRAGTFDVGCACASFPTALAAAAGIIATSSGVGNVLVVGAYMMRKLADPNDPTVFFYGDGAGAVVLRASDSPGFLGAAMQADGSFAPRWGIFSGGTYEPASETSVRERRTRVRLLERYPETVNEEGWPALVNRLATDVGFPVGAIDVAVFTQVRKSTIGKVMDRLGLPLDRAPTIMDKVGYTGSACIPMALDDARARGALRDGQLVVMVGSGVGYNQAAAAVRVTKDWVG
jgi:3-oxoacyl-[acyl-carrier-protein] synthase-3